MLKFKTEILLLIVFLPFLLFGQIQNPSEKDKIIQTESYIDSLINYANNLPEYSFNEKSSLFEKSIILAKENNYKKGLAYALLGYGLNLYNQEKISGVSLYYDQAKEILTELRDFNGLGLCYNHLANLFERFGRFDTALVLHNKALEFRTMVKNDRDISISLNNIGLLYWRQGFFNEANNYFQKALLIRLNLNDSNLIATSYNNLGTLYLSWGKYEKALEFLFLSLKIREKYNNQQGIVLTKNNIGKTYQILGFSNLAKNYFDSCYLLAKKIDFKRGLGHTYLNYSEYYIQKKLFDSSLSYATKAFTLFSESRNFNALMSSIILLGRNYLEKKEYKTAQNYFKQAIDSATHNNDIYHKAKGLQFLGLSLLLDNKLNEAQETLLNCLQICQKFGYSEILKDAYKIISDVYRKKQDYKNSLEYFDKYIALKDSLINQKLIDNIFDWRVKFETERKEIEAELIDKENQIKIEEKKREINLKIFLLIIFILISIFIVIFVRIYNKLKKAKKIINEQKIRFNEVQNNLDKQNKELQKLNNTQNKLFYLFSEHLRNPFLNISEFTENLSDPDNNDINKLQISFQKINSETRKILFILDNITYWSMLQLNSFKISTSIFTINELLEKNIKFFNYDIEIKKLIINLNIEDNLIINSDKNIIDLAIKNILSNAIRFSFENGSIEISSEIKDNKIFLTIKDNGVGIENINIPKIFDSATSFSTLGTKNEKGIGIGLGLVKDLLNKISGDLLIESKIGFGTKVTILIPY